MWNGTNSVGGCSGIFSIHPDGSGFRRLTTRSASEIFYHPQVPKFSPDGRLISFVGSCGVEVKPQPDVCVMNSDGTNEHTVATSGALKIDMRFGATWSPDGTRLAFTRSGSPSSTGANRSVYVIGVDGTGETMLVDHAYGPAWSPDGARIVVVSDREGTDKIYLVATDGSGLVRLTDGPKDQKPAWAPDGARIAFESERSGKPILRNTSDQNPTLALPPGTGGRRHLRHADRRHRHCSSDRGPRLQREPGVVARRDPDRLRQQPGWWQRSTSATTGPRSVPDPCHERGTAPMSGSSPGPGTTRSHRGRPTPR